MACQSTTARASRIAQHQHGNDDFFLSSKKPRNPTVLRFVTCFIPDHCYDPDEINVEWPPAESPRMPYPSLLPSLPPLLSETPSLSRPPPTLTSYPTFAPTILFRPPSSLPTSSTHSRSPTIISTVPSVAAPVPTSDSRGNSLNENNKEDDDGETVEAPHTRNNLKTPTAIVMGIFGSLLLLGALIIQRRKIQNRHDDDNDEEDRMPEDDDEDPSEYDEFWEESSLVSDLAGFGWQ